MRVIHGNGDEHEVEGLHTRHEYFVVEKKNTPNSTVSVVYYNGRSRDCQRVTKLHAALRERGRETSHHTSPPNTAHPLATTNRLFVQPFFLVFVHNCVVCGVLCCVLCYSVRLSCVVMC